MIRANATIAAANIIRSISQEDRRRVDIASVCHAMVLLMNPKEQNGLVRSKVARAMSLMPSV